MSIKPTPVARPQRVCYNGGQHQLLLREERMTYATERLFWNNPYLIEFEAQVMGRITHEGKPAVILDRTCFYPTSGGQPHDTGTLSGARVIDVLELDGDIVHILDTMPVEEHVTGEVDWPRRQDHMQQHAGQHLLSACFDRLLGAATLSFHMGVQECTIDLDLAALNDEQAAQVEEYANRVVMSDTGITTRQYRPEEVALLDLRKPPVVEGLVRVVSIGDIDHSPCGGTHPSSSGQIGPIHIDHWERHQNGVRVAFLCGLRAVRDHVAQSRICHALAAQASVGVSDLPEAFQRLSAATEELRHQVRSLQEERVALLSASLLSEAEPIGTGRLVSRVLENAEPGEMRALAQRLVEQPGMVALLAVGGPAVQFCLARAKDVAVNMNAILALAKQYGARGGGPPHFVQGGGLQASMLQNLFQDARKLLQQSLSVETRGDAQG
ncbi:MAG: alanyl-tRNA editing protein [Anaerolineae bacterium]|jgi:alanyl-tRNA synthetase|nr:alanyl-tRNA editing protein [Chloroflexota bacterium]